MLVCCPIRAAAVTERTLELHSQTNFKKDMGGWGFFGPKGSLRLSEIESSTSAGVFPALNSYLCKARWKTQANPQILPFLVYGSTLISPSLL